MRGRLRLHVTASFWVVMCHRTCPSLIAVTTFWYARGLDSGRRLDRTQSSKPALLCEKDKRRWPQKIPSKLRSLWILKGSGFCHNIFYIYIFLDSLYVFLDFFRFSWAHITDCQERLIEEHWLIWKSEATIDRNLVLNLICNQYKIALIFTCLWSARILPSVRLDGKNKWAWVSCY